jgi:hypothetical protein
MRKRESALELGCAAHRFLEDWHAGVSARLLTDLQADVRQALEAANRPGARVRMSLGDRVHTPRKPKR